MEVNSQRGEWIFDSGANYSTVTESEARRMGLAVRDVLGYSRDFFGAKHPTRLAVAGELRFGSARLHNVIFLVLADQSLFVPPLKYQIHGILGLPVMRSLGAWESQQKAPSLSERAHLRRESRPISSLTGSTRSCKWVIPAITCR